LHIRAATCTGRRRFFPIRCCCSPRFHYGLDYVEGPAASTCAGVPIPDNTHLPPGSGRASSLRWAPPEVAEFRENLGRFGPNSHEFGYDFVAAGVSHRAKQLAQFGPDAPVSGRKSSMARPARQAAAILGSLALAVSAMMGKVPGPRAFGGSGGSPRIRPCRHLAVHQHRAPAPGGGGGHPASFPVGGDHAFQARAFFEQQFDHALIEPGSSSTTSSRPASGRLAVRRPPSFGRPRRGAAGEGERELEGEPPEPLAVLALHRDSAPPNSAARSFLRDREGRGPRCPPKRRFIELSPWVKSWKKLGRAFAGVMPDARVAHREAGPRGCPASAGPRAVTTDPPTGAVLGET